MQLRTPKRYTSGGGGRRRKGISWRWLWLWIVTPLAVVGALAVYENPDQFVPPVNTAVANLIGDAGDAVSTARAPEPTATRNPAGDINRADDAWARGSVQEAVTIYEDIIDSTPNNLPLHYRYTLGLMMLDRDDDALVAAENAVTANPFDPNAWSIQAMVNSRTGNYGDAIASALHALEIASPQAVQENPEMMAPARARALAFLAETYYYLDQYQRGLDTVESALEVYPDSAEAYYARALLTWNTPFLVDREAAMVDYQTAYELQPSYHYIAADMVFLNNEQGIRTQDQDYFDAAIELSESILELNPDFPRVLQWLADYNLRTVGDPNQASDYAARCTRANPQLALCHYILGRSQVRLNQLLDARDSFDAAINVADENDGQLGFYYWWAAQSLILESNNCAEAMTYLRPGWEIAQESQNAALLAAYPESFGDCGSAVGQPTPTPLPQPTVEAEGDQ